MKLTLTLDLTPSAARILNDWASVGRTIDCAIRQCDKAYECAADDETDDIEATIEELVALKYSLDTIHQQIRAELWKISGGVKGALPTP